MATFDRRVAAAELSKLPVGLKSVRASDILNAVQTRGVAPSKRYTPPSLKVPQTGYELQFALADAYVPPGGKQKDPMGGFLNGLGGVASKVFNYGFMKPIMVSAATTNELIDFFQLLGGGPMPEDPIGRWKNNISGGWDDYYGFGQVFRDQDWLQDAKPWQWGLPIDADVPVLGWKLDVSPSFVAAVPFELALDPWNWLTSGMGGTAKSTALLASRAVMKKMTTQVAREAVEASVYDVVRTGAGRGIGYNATVGAAHQRNVQSAVSQIVEQIFDAPTIGTSLSEFKRNARRVVENVPIKTGTISSNIRPISNDALETIWDLLQAEAQYIKYGRGGINNKMLNTVARVAQKQGIGSEGLTRAEFIARQTARGVKGTVDEIGRNWKPIIEPGRNLASKGGMLKNSVGLRIPFTGHFGRPVVNKITRPWRVKRGIPDLDRPLGITLISAGAPWVDRTVRFPLRAGRLLFFGSARKMRMDWGRKVAHTGIRKVIGRINEPFASRMTGQGFELRKTIRHSADPWEVIGAKAMLVAKSRANAMDRRARGVAAQMANKWATLTRDQQPNFMWDMERDERGKFIFRIIEGDEEAFAEIIEALGAEAGREYIDLVRSLFPDLAGSWENMAGMPFIPKRADYAPHRLTDEAVQEINDHWASYDRPYRQNRPLPKSGHELPRKYVTPKEYEQDLNEFIRRQGETPQTLSPEQRAAQKRLYDASRNARSAEFLGIPFHEPNTPGYRGNSLANAPGIPQQIADIMQSLGMGHELFDQNIYNVIPAYINAMSKRTAEVHMEYLLREAGILAPRESWILSIEIPPLAAAEQAYFVRQATRALEREENKVIQYADNLNQGDPVEDILNLEAYNNQREVLAESARHQAEEIELEERLGIARAEAEFEYNEARASREELENARNETLAAMEEISNFPLGSSGTITDEAAEIVNRATSPAQLREKLEAVKTGLGKKELDRLTKLEQEYERLIDEIANLEVGMENNIYKHLWDSSANGIAAKVAIESRLAQAFGSVQTARAFVKWYEDLFAQQVDAWIIANFADETGRLNSAQIVRKLVDEDGMSPENAAAMARAIASRDLNELANEGFDIFGTDLANSPLSIQQAMESPELVFTSTDGQIAIRAADGRKSLEAIGIYLDERNLGQWAMHHDQARFMPERVGQYAGAGRSVFAALDLLDEEVTSYLGQIDEIAARYLALRGSNKLPPIIQRYPAPTPEALDNARNVILEANGTSRSAMALDRIIEKSSGYEAVGAHILRGQQQRSAVDKYDDAIRLYYGVFNRNQILGVANEADMDELLAKYRHALIQRSLNLKVATGANPATALRYAPTTNGEEIGFETYAHLMQFKDMLADASVTSGNQRIRSMDPLEEIINTVEGETIYFNDGLDPAGHMGFDADGNLVGESEAVPPLGVTAGMTVRRSRIENPPWTAREEGLFPGSGSVKTITSVRRLPNGRVYLVQQPNGSSELSYAHIYQIGSANALYREMGVNVPAYALEHDAGGVPYLVASLGETGNYGWRSGDPMGAPPETAGIPAVASPDRGFADPVEQLPATPIGRQIGQPTPMADPLNPVQTERAVTEGGGSTRPPENPSLAELVDEYLPIGFPRERVVPISQYPEQPFADYPLQRVGTEIDDPDAGIAGPAPFIDERRGPWTNSERVAFQDYGWWPTGKTIGLGDTDVVLLTNGQVVVVPRDFNLPEAWNLASQVDDGTSMIPPSVQRLSVDQQFSEGFIADAVLGDINPVGVANSNLSISPWGQVVRQEQGGAFRFGRDDLDDVYKPWLSPEQIDEIRTLSTPVRPEPSAASVPPALVDDWDDTVNVISQMRRLMEGEPFRVSRQESFFDAMRGVRSVEDYTHAPENLQAQRFYIEDLERLFQDLSWRRVVGGQVNFRDLRYVESVGIAWAEALENMTHANSPTMQLVASRLRSMVDDYRYFAAEVLAERLTATRMIQELETVSASDLISGELTVRVDVDGELVEVPLSLDQFIPSGSGRALEPAGEEFVRSFGRAGLSDVDVDYAFEQAQLSVQEELEEVLQDLLDVVAGPGRPDALADRPPTPSIEESLERISEALSGPSPSRGPVIDQDIDTYAAGLNVDVEDLRGAANLTDEAEAMLRNMVFDAGTTYNQYGIGLNEDDLDTILREFFEVQLEPNRDHIVAYLRHAQHMADAGWTDYNDVRRALENIAGSELAPAREREFISTRLEGLTRTADELEIRSDTPSEAAVWQILQDVSRTLTGMRDSAQIGRISADELGEYENVLRGFLDEFGDRVQNARSEELAAFPVDMLEPAETFTGWLQEFTGWTRGITEYSDTELVDGLASYVQDLEELMESEAFRVLHGGPIDVWREGADAENITDRIIMLHDRIHHMHQNLISTVSGAEPSLPDRPLNIGMMLAGDIPEVSWQRDGYDFDALRRHGAVIGWIQQLQTTLSGFQTGDQIFGNANAVEYIRRAVEASLETSRFSLDSSVSALGDVPVRSVDPSGVPSLWDDLVNDPGLSPSGRRNMLLESPLSSGRTFDQLPMAFRELDISLRTLYGDLMGAMNDPHIAIDQYPAMFQERVSAIVEEFKSVSADIDEIYTRLSYTALPAPARPNDIPLTPEESMGIAADLRDEFIEIFEPIVNAEALEMMENVTPESVQALMRSRLRGEAISLDESLAAQAQAGEVGERFVGPLQEVERIQRRLGEVTSPTMDLPPEQDDSALQAMLDIFDSPDEPVRELELPPLREELGGDIEPPDPVDDIDITTIDEWSEWWDDLPWDEQWSLQGDANLNYNDPVWRNVDDRYRMPDRREPPRGPLGEWIDQSYVETLVMQGFVIQPENLSMQTADPAVWRDTIRRQWVQTSSEHTADNFPEAFALDEIYNAQTGEIDMNAIFERFRDPGGNYEFVNKQFSESGGYGVPKVRQYDFGSTTIGLEMAPMAMARGTGRRAWTQPPLVYGASGRRVVQLHWHNAGTPMNPDEIAMRRQAASRIMNKLNMLMDQLDDENIELMTYLGGVNFNVGPSRLGEANPEDYVQRKRIYELGGVRFFPVPESFSPERAFMDPSEPDWVQHFLPPPVAMPRGRWDDARNGYPILNPWKQEALRTTDPRQGLVNREIPEIGSTSYEHLLLSQYLGRGHQYQGFRVPRRRNIHSLELDAEVLKVGRQELPIPDWAREVAKALDFKPNDEYLAPLVTWANRTGQIVARGLIEQQVDDLLAVRARYGSWKNFLLEQNGLKNPTLEQMSNVESMAAFLDHRTRKLADVFGMQVFPDNSDDLLRSQAIRAGYGRDTVQALKRDELIPLLKTVVTSDSPNTGGGMLGVGGLPGQRVRYQISSGSYADELAPADTDDLVAAWSVNALDPIGQINHEVALDLSQRGSVRMYGTQPWQREAVRQQIVQPTGARPRDPRDMEQLGLMFESPAGAVTNEDVIQPQTFGQTLERNANFNNGLPFKEEAQVDVLLRQSPEDLLRVLNLAKQNPYLEETVGLWGAAVQLARNPKYRKLFSTGTNNEQEILQNALDFVHWRLSETLSRTAGPQMDRWLPPATEMGGLMQFEIQAGQGFRPEDAQRVARAQTSRMVGENVAAPDSIMHRNRGRNWGYLLDNRPDVPVSPRLNAQQGTYDAIYAHGGSFDPYSRAMSHLPTAYGGDAMLTRNILRRIQSDFDVRRRALYEATGLGYLWEDMGRWETVAAPGRTRSTVNIDDISPTQSDLLVEEILRFNAATDPSMNPFAWALNVRQARNMLYRDVERILRSIPPEQMAQIFKKYRLSLASDGYNAIAWPNTNHIPQTSQVGPGKGRQTLPGDPRQVQEGELFQRMLSPEIPAHPWDTMQRNAPNRFNVDIVPTNPLALVRNNFKSIGDEVLDPRDYVKWFEEKALNEILSAPPPQEGPLPDLLQEAIEREQAALGSFQAIDRAWAASFDSLMVIEQQLDEGKATLQELRDLVTYGRERKSKINAAIDVIYQMRASREALGQNVATGEVDVALWHAEQTALVDNLESAVKLLAQKDLEEFQELLAIARSEGLHNARETLVRNQSVLGMKQGKPVVEAAINRGFRAGYKPIGVDSSGEEAMLDAMGAAFEWDKRGRANAFTKYYDKVHNVTKGYMIFSPGFFFRNYYGGMFMNFLAEVSPVRYAQFIKANRVIELENKLANTTKAVTAKELKKLERKQGKVPAEHLAYVRELQEAGAYGAGQAGVEFDSALTTANTRVRIAGKEVALKSLNPFSSNFIALRGARNVNMKVETLLRGTLGFDRLAKGASMDEAIGDIVKFHFDYDDLSLFERGVVKRLSPFYTWTRRAIPLMVEQLPKRGSVFSKYLQSMRQLEAPTEDVKGVEPRWLVRQGGIPISPKFRGFNLWLAPDLPPRTFFDMVNPATRGGMSLEDRGREILRAGTGMLTPFAKAPLEFYTKRNFWKGYHFNGTVEWVPPVMTGIPGLMPVLGQAGLAKKNENGVWGMKDYQLHTVIQFLPLLNAARRLSGQEERYDERLLSTWVSFVFGVGLRTNTAYEQEMELRGRSYEKRAELTEERQFARLKPDN